MTVETMSVEERMQAAVTLDEVDRPRFFPSW